MIEDVADDFAVCFDAKHLWIVCHLSELALCFLKVCMVLHLRLELGVLSQSSHLRCLNHCSGLCLRNVRLTIGELVITLVGFHVEGHAASLALETCLVPDLVETFQFLGGIHALLAPSTRFIHVENSIS